MAGRALITELAGVRVVFRMTGGAVHRRAFEDAVDVTACAINCRVFSVKMEGEFRVIHRGRLPAIGCVT